MKVVVTGATGFVGTDLVAKLLARDDRVVVLSRDGERAKAQLGDVTAVTADLETPGPWAEALAGADAIIHLAGQSVAAKRWDAREKQIIRDSRVEATRVLVEAIAAMSAADRPRALVAASGIDYYPFAGGPIEFDDDEVTESDVPGDSFLSRVCRDWEEETRAAEKHGVRTVSMRIGFVLGPGGGLGKMTKPFKFFVGGRIGNGRQWVSWIHRADLVAALLAAIDDDRYRGPFNLVTESVRQYHFAAALGRVLHRPSWLPVPAFAVKAAAGELSAYLLHGRRAVPKKLAALGFAWTFPELEAALRDALA